MPREVFHWRVLDDSLEKVRESAPTVHRFCSQHREIARLGAVAHDAPYYRSYGTSHFAEAAECLHGTEGEDTYAPFRRGFEFLRNVSTIDREFCYAFLAGMLSHAAADVEVHPFVYYLTGDYYDRDEVERNAARARHRGLEVYIDAWTMREKNIPDERSIRKMLNVAGKRMDLITCLLAHMESIEELSPNENANEWRLSFEDLAKIQRLLLSPAVGLVFRVLTYVAPKAYRSLSALSSFRRGVVPEFLEGAIDVKNPVTGREERVTLHELFDRSTQRTIELLNKLERHIAGEDHFSECGPSLNCGLEKKCASEFCYFAEKFFEER